MRVAVLRLTRPALRAREAVERRPVGKFHPASRPGQYERLTISPVQEVRRDCFNNLNRCSAIDLRMQEIQPGRSGMLPSKIIRWGKLILLMVSLAVLSQQPNHELFA